MASASSTAARNGAADLRGSPGCLRTDVIDIYYLHRSDKRKCRSRTPSARSRSSCGRRGARDRSVGGFCDNAAQGAREVQPDHRGTGRILVLVAKSRDRAARYLRRARRSFVAFSPLGRGFLRGRHRSVRDVGPKISAAGCRAFRSRASRRTTSCSATSQTLATSRLTPAQLAIAWLLQKAPYIVPIVGTMSLAHLEEDSRRGERKLSPADLAKVESADQSGQQ